MNSFRLPLLRGRQGRNIQRSDDSISVVKCVFASVFAVKKWRRNVSNTRKRPREQCLATEPHNILLRESQNDHWCQIRFWDESENTFPGKKSPFHESSFWNCNIFLQDENMKQYSRPIYLNRNLSDWDVKTLRIWTYILAISKPKKLPGKKGVTLITISIASSRSKRLQLVFLGPKHFSPIVGIDGRELKAANDWNRWNISESRAEKRLDTPTRLLRTFFERRKKVFCLVSLSI